MSVKMRWDVKSVRVMEEGKEDSGGEKAKIKGWKNKKRDAEVKSVIGVRQAKAIKCEKGESCRLQRKKIKSRNEK